MLTWMGSRTWTRAAAAVVMAMLLVPAIAGPVAAATPGQWSVANDPTVVEGNSGTKTVAFTIHYEGDPSANPGNTVRVAYATSNGTATSSGTCPGYDYARITSTNTALVDPTTSHDITVDVTICGDNSNEAGETFTLNLSSATGSSSVSSSRGSGTATIVNDDASATTTTSISSNHNPSTAGQSVTLTATFTRSSNTGSRTGGTMIFFDGDVILGTATTNSSGRATFATSALTVGSHSITAVYVGTTFYSGSTSATLTQNVNKIATTTTVKTSGSPSVVGATVTFTATVTPSAATGTVTFLDGGTVIGTGTLTGGKASFPTSALTVGTHSITARYEGNASYATSTSAIRSQVVNPAPVTITSSANPSVLNSSVTFTATVFPATRTGTVTFRDGGTGGTILGTRTLSGGSASFTTSSLTLGSHTITAVFGANNASVSQLVSVRVTFYSELCPSYSVVYANENYWDGGAGHPDATGGHTSELLTGQESADANPATQLPAACHGDPGWTFNLYSPYYYNSGTGDSVGSVTTGAGGTESIILDATLLGYARNGDSANALWVTEALNPDRAGFAGLRCYTNVLYSDNQETIYTATVPDIYCIAYNVQTLSLTKTPSSPTYTASGQTITYTYTLKNTGTPTSGSLTAPFAVSDDKITAQGHTVSCPATGTIAYGETATCTADYVIDDTDMANGSVVNTATATAAWGAHTVTSNTATATITGPAVSPSIKLTKSPSQSTYSQLGTAITYTYVLSNDGNVTLTDLAVSDDKATVACPPTASLAPGLSITCSAPYLTPDADSVTNIATATARFGATQVQVSAQATITRAVLTITAPSPTITYGEGIPVIAPSYSGFLHGETATPGLPTCTTTAVDGDSIGNYATQCSGAVDADYTIHYVDGILTIDPADLWITANDRLKDYGDTLVLGDSAFIHTAMASGDDVTSVTLSDPDGGLAALDPVGDYRIVPSVAIGTGLSNYTIHYVNGTLHVTGADAVVTLTCPATEPFTGSAWEPCTATVTGAGIGTLDISDQIVYSDNVNVGLAGATVTWSDANHNPASDSGGFQILPADAVVTLTCPATEPYTGSAWEPCTATVTGAGIGTLDISDQIDYSDNVNVGLAGATVTWSDANHNPASASGGFQILPADAVVTLTCPSQETYKGSAWEPCTATVTGAGIDSLDVSDQIVYSDNVNVGPAGATVTWSDANHNPASASGGFEIVVAPLQITASNETMVYGGPVPPVTPIYDGFVGSDTAPAVPPICSADVATLTTSCSGASDPNYSITYVDGTLSVGPATVTVTADNQSRPYGDPNPTLTYQASGFIGSDDFSVDPICTTTADSTSSVGGSPYAITCDGGEASANYTIVYEPGNLTVTPWTLTITADNQSKVQGDPIPPLTYTVGGWIAGDDDGDMLTAPNCTTTADADSPGGTYPITCSDAVAPEHYVLAYNAGTLTVNAPALAITKSANVAHFDHLGQTVTYTYRVINVGTAAFGSATQFSVSDDLIGDFDCGPAAALTPNTGTLGSPSAGSFVACTHTYQITSTDLDNGSVTNTASASGGGYASGSVSVTITAVGPEITLVKLADTESWGAVGDVIQYSYVITNTGSTVIDGPFSVDDDMIAVACPSTPTSLDHGESITCTASYTTQEFGPHAHHHQPRHSARRLGSGNGLGRDRPGRSVRAGCRRDVRPDFACDGPPHGHLEQLGSRRRHSALRPADLLRLLGPGPDGRSGSARDHSPLSPPTGRAQRPLPGDRRAPCGSVDRFRAETQPGRAGAGPTA